MTVSTEDKMIARAASNAFAGKPTVTRYWDDNHISSVDILACADSPSQGLTSFSTIGVSHFNIGFSVNDIALRTEFVGASRAETSFFPNILATCAFFVINSNYACYPGAMYRNVVSMYEPSSDMKHIMFVQPFLWDEKLDPLDFSDKKMTWLLAVPISNAEFTFAIENGTDELERAFEEQQIDIFNLRRESVL